MVRHRFLYRGRIVGRSPVDHTAPGACRAAGTLAAGRAVTGGTAWLDHNAAGRQVWSRRRLAPAWPSAFAAGSEHARLVSVSSSNQRARLAPSTVASDHAS